MSEIKELGRIISVTCLIVIWLFSLVWSIRNSENINRNSHIEVLLAEYGF